MEGNQKYRVVGGQGREKEKGESTRQKEADCRLQTADPDSEPAPY